MLFLAQSLVKAGPTRANTIDPRAESAVGTREVPEIMREHGFELVEGHDLHERQAKDQKVLLPTEKAETGNLHDRRV